MNLIPFPFPHHSDVTEAEYHDHVNSFKRPPDDEDSASLLDVESQSIEKETQHTPTSSNGHHQVCWRIVWCFLVVATTLPVILAVAVRPYPVPNETSGPLKGALSYDCGTSVSEARARGFNYDTLAASWLPDACRDDRLSADLNNAGLNGTWNHLANKEATTVSASLSCVVRCKRSRLCMPQLPPRRQHMDSRCEESTAQRQ